MILTVVDINNGVSKLFFTSRKKWFVTFSKCKENCNFANLKIVQNPKIFVECCKSKLLLVWVKLKIKIFSKIIQKSISNYFKVPGIVQIFIFLNFYTKNIVKTRWKNILAGPKLLSTTVFLCCKECYVWWTMHTLGMLTSFQTF